MFELRVGCFYVVQTMAWRKHCNPKFLGWQPDSDSLLLSSLNPSTPSKKPKSAALNDNWGPQCPIHHWCLLIRLRKRISESSCPFTLLKFDPGGDLPSQRQNSPRHSLSQNKTDSVDEPRVDAVEFGKVVQVIPVHFQKWGIRLLFSPRCSR